MLQELREINRLSAYFRNVQIYQDYLSSCEAYDRAMKKLMLYLAEEDNGGRPGAIFSKRILASIKSIVGHQDVLDNWFSVFDFCDSSIESAKSEFKLVVYVFCREFLIGEREKHAASFHTLAVLKTLHIIRQFLEINFCLLGDIIDEPISAAKQWFLKQFDDGIAFRSDAYEGRDL